MSGNRSEGEKKAGREVRRHRQGRGKLRLDGWSGKVPKEGAPEHRLTTVRETGTCVQGSTVDTAGRFGGPAAGERRHVH